MPSRQPVTSNEAPRAIGPYSQAMRCGDWVFLSGQIALDPATGELVSGDIGAQVRQVFENLSRVAQAAGGSLAQAVKVTVYLTDLAHFAVVNDIMARYFAEPFPARAAVGVAALPKGAQVEADAIIAA